jgi:hypothetical protein
VAKGPSCVFFIVPTSFHVLTKSGFLVFSQFRLGPAIEAALSFRDDAFQAEFARLGELRQDVGNNAHCPFGLAV